MTQSQQQANYRSDNTATYLSGCFMPTGKHIYSHYHWRHWLQLPPPSCTCKLVQFITEAFQCNNHRILQICVSSEQMHYSELCEH